MSENDSNIITLKLKYSTDENSKTQILEYMQQEGFNAELQVAIQRLSNSLKNVR